MYYLNSSGRDIRFSYGPVIYTIPCWERKNLPDELYDFLDGNIDIPLEVDYEMHIALAQEEIAFANQWSEFKDKEENAQFERIGQWP